MKGPPHSSPRLILASASPRRAELLREHGYRFEVVPPPLEEPAELSGDLTPIELAEALSFFKAKCVAESLGTLQGWILAADTLATLDGEIFGKPCDVDDARRILETLSGTTHHVITGITLLDAARNRRLIRHDVTAITMRKLAPRQLDQYLDSGQWQGKAGAYGIQDKNDPFVEKIEGSFTNVVGLPMELLGRMLDELSPPM